MMKFEDLARKSGQELVEWTEPLSPPLLKKRRRLFAPPALAIASLTAVVAIAGGMAVGGHTSTEPVDITVAEPGITLALGDGSIFEPLSEPINELKARILLVMLDGTRIELVVPSDLADRVGGFAPTASLQWEDGECCERGLDIRHGSIKDIFGDLQPTATYPDARGESAFVFESDIGYLAFQFGSWVVLVGAEDLDDPPLSDGEMASLAAHLGGFQTPEGFLVLNPVPPLKAASSNSPDAWLSAKASREHIMDIATEWMCSDEGNRTAQGYPITVDRTDGTVERSVCSPEHSVMVGGPDISVLELDRIEIRIPSRDREPSRYPGEDHVQRPA